MTVRTFVLDVPWELRSSATSLGARYDAKHKAWLYKGESLPSGLVDYGSEDFSWERWIEDDINHSCRSTKTTSLMIPRDHQMLAAKKILWSSQRGYRGFVEADGTGVGKTLATLIGLYGVAKINGFTPKKRANLLVVCPNSAIEHWRNTLAASGVTQLFRITVINYERTKKLLIPPKSAVTAKRVRTKNRRIASEGTPSVKWDFVVADECQRLKNIFSAQQSKAFDRIARYSESPSTAPFVVWVSATVGQNPVELGSLSPLISQMTGNTKTSTKSWGDYLLEKGYHVKKAKVGVTWVSTRPDMPLMMKNEIMRGRQEDLQRMRKLLFDKNSPSIRRLPTDIAGWPELQIIPLPVALSPKSMVLYRAAWLEFRDALRLIRRGKNPAGGLAVQLRFRQKISLLKAPETVDHILDLLESGFQVVVGVEFLETLDIMRSALQHRGVTVAEISGRMDKKVKEEQRLIFQRGDASVVFTTIFDNISLHSKERLPDGSFATDTDRASVVHDIQYSGIENFQFPGRTHRDGQNSILYYIVCSGTIEEQIADTAIKRMADIHTISGDAEELAVTIQSLLDKVVGV